MNQRLTKELFEEVALLANIIPAFIEKDWFVTQVVAAFAENQIDGCTIVFTGGTALAKAYKLIHRFSEDVDFKIITDDPHSSRKALSLLRKKLIEMLNEYGFNIDEQHVQARDNNHYFVINYLYPSYFSHSNALRPHLKIEVTIKAPLLSPHYLPISSIVNTLCQQSPEIPSIACIDPLESIADKMSALAWRIHEDATQREESRTLVRHLHDIALMQNMALTNPQFPSLLSIVMQHDKQRLKKHPTLAQATMDDKFQCLLALLEQRKTFFSHEYELFVKGVSFAPEHTLPSYSNAVLALQKLILYSCQHSSTI